MALFGGIGVLGIALLLFWLWALYDVVTSDAGAVRNLPKVMWVVIVLLLSPLALNLGPILWVFLGRPMRSAASSQPHGQRRVRRAPEPVPEADRHTHRVVTDRRSAELDRMLEEWERTKRDEAAPES
jgi:hypothetical protein